MTQRCMCLLTSLVLAAVAGCGKGGAGPTWATPYPVHGTVTMAGKTVLNGGIVSFTPKEPSVGGKRRYTASGLVDNDGHYKVGLGDDRGVPAGEYVVTVEPLEAEGPQGNSRKIPTRYWQKSESPFTVTVVEKDNTFDFELQ